MERNGELTQIRTYGNFRRPTTAGLLDVIYTDTGTDASSAVSVWRTLP